MRAGKININNVGVVSVFYEFVSVDTIRYVDPSGRYHYTHYKSLIV